MLLDDPFLEAETPQHYQVFARRTRPQSFSELVGQEVIVKTLESMLSSGRIPHAFLFTGTRGTGKTSSARILAKSLCCEKGPTFTPCQTCVHCKQITACAHEDVLEIDGASNTGVDQIRELRESARFYPNSSRYRIFVIDEVHMLSIGAFNALLKILEEPPPQVYFILATTELHKVPITVRSRCTILPFKKIDAEKIVGHLKGILSKENVGFDENALTLIARAAKGSLRDSLSLLEQVIALSGGTSIDENSTRQALSLLGHELTQSLAGAILAQDSYAALLLLKEAENSSIDLSLLLEDTASYFRSALVARGVTDNARALKLTQLLPQELEFARKLTEKTSAAALNEIYRTLANGAREVARSKDTLSWAEITLLDCISRADWLSSEELLSLLNGEGTRHTTPPPAPTTTTPPHRSTQGSETQRTAPANSSDSGVTLFAKVVSALQTKSVTLAAKLKNAVLQECSAQKIVFADTPSNSLYTQLNSVESQLFRETLAELGLEKAELKGVELAKETSKTGAKTPAATRAAPPRNQRAGASTADVFDELLSSAPSRVDSVATLERNKKLAELKEKETRLMNLESVRKLSEIATSVEIHPLDETSK